MAANENIAESGSDKSQILLFVKTCLPAVDCLEIRPFSAFLKIKLP